MGTALTVERGMQLLEKLPVVLVRMDRATEAIQHKHGARLIRIVGTDKVEIHPHGGHKKNEIVPIDSVYEWHSRNEQLATTLGINIDAIEYQSKPIVKDPKDSVKFVIVSKIRKSVYLNGNRWSANPLHGTKYHSDEIGPVYSNLVQEMSEKTNEDQEDDLLYMSVEEATKFIGELMDPITSIKHAPRTDPAMEQIIQETPISKSVVPGTFVPTQFTSNMSVGAKLEAIQTRQRKAMEKLIECTQIANSLKITLLGCNEESAQLLLPMCDQVNAELAAKRAEIKSDESPTPSLDLPKWKKAPRGSTTARVFAAIRENPDITVSQLSKKLPNLKRNHAGIVVSNLLKDKLVKRVNSVDGFIYTVTSKGVNKFKP